MKLGKIIIEFAGKYLENKTLMNSVDASAQDKIEHVKGTLSELSATVHDGIKNTESPFLSLGNALQASYSESGDLINIITGSVDKFNDDSGNNLVSGVENAIQKTLGKLAGYPAKIDADVGHISGSAQSLEKLREACSNLSTISRFLNVVGLNIGIEGCRSPEATEMFRGFDEEIKELSKKISDITDKIHSDAAQILDDHKKGLTGISQKAGLLKKLTKEADTAVMVTMENVRTLSDHSCKALDNAEKTATAIQNRTGEIVMAIQFHDIARQRLEHVISSFKDVQAALDRSRQLQDDRKTGDIKISPQVVSTLKIQSGQIRHVADEIEQAHGNITASLGDIRIEVAALTNLLDESCGSGERKNGLEAEVESMTVQMSDLKQLDIQARSLGDEMITTIRKSSDIVADLSRYADQIRNINTNIRYKALNAIIMTSKLGKKGATLEVLAREVGNISVECDSLVKETLENLKSISGLAALLTDPKADDSAGNGKAVDLGENISGISAAVDAYSSDSAIVSERAQDLEKQIEQTSEGLSFLTAWIEQLRQTHSELTELITSIEPFIDEDADDSSAIKDENLSERYTMQSERNIHEQISKDPGDKADSKKKPIKDNEQKDGFDDNFELF